MVATTFLLLLLQGLIQYPRQAGDGLDEATWEWHAAAGPVPGPGDGSAASGAGAGQPGAEPWGLGNPAQLAVLGSSGNPRRSPGAGLKTLENERPS
ncbi:hypothetical protein HGM15179_017925 [Zosterops borbonicus]|uniref:Uncharacterized protein n=1 Tax=Zosterops borbonicus TaxID=364589 RepID=A0A8K1FZY3_9PASS|nr:hypothetical protein HGM15179_017925 [Zosterops borbonicus]